MPSDVFTFEGTQQAKIVYLKKSPDMGWLSALQGLRSKTMKCDSEAAREYKSLTWKYAKQLRAEVQGSFDAMIVPPSTHDRAMPYAQELVECCHVDITKRFKRAHGTRSGDGCSITQLMSAVSFSPIGDEANFKKILIVDDIVASGNTVAVIVDKLKSAGMPNQAAVWVACPLWLPSGVPSR